MTTPHIPGILTRALDVPLQLPAPKNGCTIIRDAAACVPPPPRYANSTWLYRRINHSTGSITDHYRPAILTPSTQNIHLHTHSHHEQ